MILYYLVENKQTCQNKGTGGNQTVAKDSTLQVQAPIIMSVMEILIMGTVIQKSIRMLMHIQQLNASRPHEKINRLLVMIHQLLTSVNHLLMNHTLHQP